MDVYPIEHKRMILNVVTDLDLSFVELRGVLDSLVEERAFEESTLDDPGPGRLFDIEFGGTVYVVDVFNKDVVIYSREEPGDPRA